MLFSGFKIQISTLDIFKADFFTHIVIGELAWIAKRWM